MLLVKDNGNYQNVYANNGALEVLVTHSKVINKLEQFKNKRIFFQKNGNIFSSGIIQKIEQRNDVFSVYFAMLEKLNEAPLGRSYGSAFYTFNLTKRAA